MIHYGGDYNPEQWPRETWREDMRFMREAGVTLVSLGIFAWSRIQPAEGEFDWEWLDEVIDLLHDNGIAVDLATATASPPPWATTAYPAMLPQDENGAVYGPGSRQHYAPSSPDYRRLAADLVSALATRYARHPAIVMWHVNNEYGCHLHYDYSDNAAVAFRSWLRDTYVDIEALNEAWGTAFWSQRYTDFEQVLPPRKAPYSLNPAGLLDFKRFTSETLIGLYRMERDIIRAAGATQPITTNFMGAFAPADYWAWAAEVDVISDDCYPDPNDPESFREAAFARDLMRSLKPGVPWILMEQATNALNWRPSNAPKAPGQMAALSIQAVARGADGVLFFQWRQSRAGSEKFHSAMLPHAGTRTRTWREVVSLGTDLAALPALPAPTPSRVAIVWDWENAWALESPDHPVVFDHLALVRRWHAAAHRLHVQVDFVRPASDLSGYDVVIAPQLYLLTRDGADSLRAFAEAGGHLLVTAFSDVVDENDAFLPGGYLTRLGPTLGIWVEDFGALVVEGPGQATAPVAGVVDLLGTLFAEEVHLDGATELARFEGGRLHGRPAFTRSGSAYYLATVPDEVGTATVLRHLFEAAGIEPVVPGLPMTVEAARRGDVITLINHSEEPTRVRIDGRTFAGDAVTEVALGAYGYTMVRVG